MNIISIPHSMSRLSLVFRWFKRWWHSMVPVGCGGAFAGTEKSVINLTPNSTDTADTAYGNPIIPVRHKNKLVLYSSARKHRSLVAIKQIDSFIPGIWTTEDWVSNSPSKVKSQGWNLNDATKIICCGTNLNGLLAMSNAVMNARSVCTIIPSVGTLRTSLHWRRYIATSHNWKWFHSP